MQKSVYLNRSDGHQRDYHKNNVYINYVHPCFGKTDARPTLKLHLFYLPIFVFRYISLYGDLINIHDKGFQQRFEIGHHQDVNIHSKCHERIFSSRFDAINSWN